MLTKLGKIFEERQRSKNKILAESIVIKVGLASSTIYKLMNEWQINHNFALRVNKMREREDKTLQLTHLRL